MTAFCEMMLQLRRQSCRYGTSSFETLLRADVAVLERRYQMKLLKRRDRRTGHFLPLLRLFNWPR